VSAGRSAIGARPYEIVLFGASGFTGRLTAEYLARAAPDLRWALAGRNLTKLAALRERLAAIDPALAGLALLSADANSPDSLRVIAEQAAVLISTVGPYLRYGDPLVAACAAAGTDYVDLTGEPEFVDRVWLAYHQRARRSGARLVHSCGFDSIPFDLGVLFCVLRMPEGAPLRVEAFLSASGGFSGGTYHSAIEVLSRLRQGAAVAAQRRRLEERPEGRRVRGIARPPHRDPDAGGWVVPLPTIDPQHVLRSACALERYGPDFGYGHYLRIGSLARLAAFAAGAGTLVAAAQLQPTRELLRRIKQPGEGPSAAQRARSFFSVKLRAEGGGRAMLARVSGGDPGYGETSKMLAESALCLARDALPERAGQLTPAVAMGEALIERLINAGIRFEVLREG
jgi:short subunit dehydrogenase-like uncharacterized protein